MTYRSNTKVFIKETISSSAIAWDEFNISEDFESWVNLETWADIVSFVLKDWTQIERFEITATWWVATIVKRWLTQANEATEDSNLNKQWNDWTVWYITALAFDLADLGWDNTFNWNQTINWEVTTTWDVNLADTKGIVYDADFYIRRSGNDMLFKDKSNPETSLTDINALSWADTKVAASPADTTTWTLDEKVIAWDWISKTINNPGWTETYELSTDYWTTANTACEWNDARLDQATEWNRWTVNKATNAEIIAWTEDTKFITSKQNLTTWVIASDTEILNWPTEKTRSWTWATVKQATLWDYRNWWTVRVKYEGRWEWPQTDAQSRVLVDDVQVYTLNYSPTWATRTPTNTDIIVDANSVIKIQIQETDVWAAYLKNFTLSYDEAVIPKTAILDIN